MTIVLHSGNKNCVDSFFYDMGIVRYISQPSLIIVDFKAYEKLVFQHKTFYQRAKRDIQQEKRVILLENLLSDYMQNRVILIENVVSNVSMCYSVQNIMLSKVKTWTKNFNQLQKV